MTRHNSHRTGRLLPFPFRPVVCKIIDSFARGEIYKRIAFEDIMAKTQRKLKKANHGRRPASAKARKQKRKKFKT